jgi:hypothetical protein
MSIIREVLLRPAQMRARVGNLKQLLDKVPESQVLTIMAEAGVEEIYKKYGRLREAEDEPAIMELQDPEEILKRAMLDGAKRLDPSMTRLLQQHVSEQKVRKLMESFSLNITPYEIPDKSIADILLECHEDVVDAAEQAIEKRREADHADALLHGTPTPVS